MTLVAQVQHSLSFRVLGGWGAQSTPPPCQSTVDRIPVPFCIFINFFSFTLQYARLECFGYLKAGESSGRQNKWYTKI